MNHAILVAAVTQVGRGTPGSVYHLLRKQPRKSRKEAMRELKRRISDAVYQRLLTDARR